MRLRIVVVASSVSLLIGCLAASSSEAPTSAQPDLEELQSELERLRNETCVEIGLMDASVDLLRIELKRLHGIPPDAPLVEGFPEAGSSYETATMEVLGRIYTIPPRGNGANRLLNTCP